MAERSRTSKALSWVVTLLTMYALYLLFTSNLQKAELLAGVGAAVVATLAAGVFGVLGVVQFRPRTADLLQIWRLPYYMVVDTGSILKGLARQLFTKKGADSLVRAVPYRLGGDDPRSEARRALAVTYTTMTPNFIAFGIARKQKLLLFHQIVETAVPQMTINLGAEP